MYKPILKLLKHRFPPAKDSCIELPEHKRPGASN